MTTIDHATVIDAEASRVWRVLRRFGDIATWFPGVTQSKIEDGLPDQTVGAVRAMVLSDGNPLRERLLSMDDKNRSLSYGFEESSLPYDDFVLTVRLVPLDDGSRTFIRWTAHFDVQPQHDRETGIQALRDLIVAGDASLHAFFRDDRDR
ncbi:SRPBCC family protein [Streptomyces scabiei]|uniref:SRPBCC family protein n=1 Tax=Streptomyces scabiei TaxID=1930 RepID=UPI00298FAE8A|nr:SRPBCC family protein [Streptomyces scabiei]MDW8803290.1 SRPBCC family protein [Streptomyces scabiei]